MKQAGPYYTLLLALLFLFSRGLFEPVLQKSTAYLVSALGFFVFVAIFILLTRSHIASSGRAFHIALLLIGSSLISAVLTIYKGQESSYLIYLIFPLVISLTLFMFSSIKYRKMDRERISITLGVITLVLFVVATLQQARLLYLPGETFTFGSFIRPPSLTGSYLHYPLIMCLLGSCIWSLNKRFTWSSLLAFTSVFVSFSRSGMLIVILIAIYIIISQATAFLASPKIKLNHIKRLLRMLFLTLISVLAISFTEFGDFVYERLITSTSSTASGNELRIKAWEEGIVIWLDGNILFGENFGLKTNLTKNLSNTHTGVVESGVIQSLVNLGLIGTIIFYSIFWILFKISNTFVLKSFIFAFFFQSFVYQSIEVMPFMLGTLLLIPLCASVSSAPQFRVLSTLKNTSPPSKSFSNV